MASVIGYTYIYIYTSSICILYLYIYTVPVCGFVAVSHNLLCHNVALFDVYIVIIVIIYINNAIVQF